jgi:hypothetical protein
MNQKRAESCSRSVTLNRLLYRVQNLLRWYMKTTYCFCSETSIVRYWPCSLITISALLPITIFRSSMFNLCKLNPWKYRMTSMDGLNFIVREASVYTLLTISDVLVIQGKYVICHQNYTCITFLSVRLGGFGCSSRALSIT